MKKKIKKKKKKKNHTQLAIQVLVYEETRELNGVKWCGQETKHLDN